MTLAARFNYQDWSKPQYDQLQDLMLQLNKVSQSATKVMRISEHTLTAGQTAITTSFVYAPGNSEITMFVNGVKQRPADFVETDATTITLVVPAIGGEEVDIIYGQTYNALASSGGVTTIKYQSVTATASQTVINTDFDYIPGSHTLWVFVNGEMQEVGIDYTETDLDTITFIVPLIVGDKVLLLNGSIYDIAIAHPVMRVSEHVLSAGQTVITTPFTYSPGSS